MSPGTSPPYAGAARPVILDLYCGAGGAARGYVEAGFDVIGVDKEPQPNYPYEFHRADALSVLRSMVGWPSFSGALWRPDSYAAVHASPTCQHRARVTAWRGRREDHPDTLTPTLALLRQLDLPWVVENVPEAVRDGTLRPDVELCGTQFGLSVKRHRVFECGNWSAFDLVPRCVCYRNPRLLPFMHKGERAFADAMGCTWMTNKEARQAIPPAYTRWIGERLMARLGVTCGDALSGTATLGHVTESGPEISTVDGGAR